MSQSEKEEWKHFQAQLLPTSEGGGKREFDAIDEPEEQGDGLFNFVPAVEKADIAHYVAESTHDLALLAERANLPFLAYLLQLARDEARTNAKLG